MKTCAYCGAPTVLYVNNTPICLDCDAKRETGQQLSRPKPPRAPDKDRKE